MHSSRLLSIVLLIATLSLTACGARISSCPPLVSYTDAQKGAVATELQSLPQPSATVGMISDYVVLRDQLKACQP